MAYRQDRRSRRAGLATPFGEKRAIFRGFNSKRLGTVLETGLDWPTGSPFFGCTGPAKAWKYPIGRRFPALLVLDADRIVDARFEPERSANEFDEQTYGFRVLGDGRAALLAVVLGGPRSAVMDLLAGLELASDYRLEYEPQVIQSATRS